MNNQDLIDKHPTNDDIEGLELQRYKKNLHKKRIKAMQERENESENENG
jgi:hypothetical protein